MAKGLLVDEQKQALINQAFLFGKMKQNSLIADRVCHC